MIDRFICSIVLALATVFPVSAQVTAQLRVEVKHDGAPVAAAAVSVGALARVTDAAGVVILVVSPGRVTIRVTRKGFASAEQVVSIGAQAQTVVIDLEETIEVEEEVVVVASTRTGKRLEDEPLRVEVVPADEVQEKLMMAPGDISMLLNETNGLRVQTSPSLGGANVRIQGLRGRYSQVLSDGLPLFGAQTGSIGLLQIPPMDLGQVEVIKGVASALYGMSAVGGVVNLVSRRPPAEGHEGEVLVNTTSHAATDIVPWLAGAIDDQWKYTFVGGFHAQDRSDLDRDGWTDLPSYRRVVARPRVFWDNGAGRSVLATLGVMSEGRDGGTMPKGLAPDGRPFAEAVDTTRFDTGAVGRFVTAKGFVVAARVSATSQRSERTYGLVHERDRRRVVFSEVSVTGASGSHTWVAGGAISYDRFRSRDVSRFDYAYTVPAAFVQDDFAPNEKVTVSGSARVDAHSEFGTFVSPRVSLLVRPGDDWSVRVTGGRGHFAPTVFTEETEATGLTPVAPLTAREAERATSGSADVTWTPGRLEFTLTTFRSNRRWRARAARGGRRGLSRCRGSSGRARPHARDRVHHALSPRGLRHRGHAHVAAIDRAESVYDRPPRCAAQSRTVGELRSAQADRPGADRVRGLLHGPSGARAQPVSGARSGAHARGRPGRLGDRAPSSVCQRREPRQRAANALRAARAAGAR